MMDETAQNEAKTDCDFSEITNRTYCEEQDDFTNNSISSYSEDEIDSSTERSRPQRAKLLPIYYHHISDPAQPYRELVSSLQAQVWPDLQKAITPNDETVASLLPYQGTTSTARNRYPGKTRLIGELSISQSDLQPIPEATFETFKAIAYTATQSPTKAVRFEDTAAELAAPSTDLNNTKVTPPFPKSEESNPRSILLRRLQSLRRPLRESVSGKEQIVRVVGVPGRDPTPDMLQCERTRAAVKNELPFYESARVPIKKGWVRKVAQAISERGQVRL